MSRDQVFDKRKILRRKFAQHLKDREKVRKVCKARFVL